jgi:hypothetical protein
VPEGVSVVEVYGSKFLLEWLDREVLASAVHPLADCPAPASPPREQAA